MNIRGFEVDIYRILGGGAVILDSLITLRRAALTAALLAALIVGNFAGICSISNANAETTPFEWWAQSARIGGAAVWADMTPTEVNTLVDRMSAQNVSVIEADSDLSNYLTDTQFEQELVVMRNLATAAHAKGIKVIWYYPGLEVLTPNGTTSASTMYKDHPDWVQIGLNGTDNVFYGGLVFWVDPGMESAWMAPSSVGYRAYFSNRVKAIAGTGIDGLWLDVPLLNDIGVDWADTSPASKSKFEDETGWTTPGAVNWGDEAWRRWVNWRHSEITDFLIAVRDAANTVAPNFKLFVETVTMDYTAPTKIALDGAALKDLPGLTQVWELDAISDTNAMRKAKEDDWISLIAMNKFARGASGKNPSWIFTYGKQANDAELVMAEAIAAGNSPYETKIPEMTTTVGEAYRTKMFGWIKANEAYLPGVRKGPRVAVLYSPASRDYVDQAKGTGLYVTTKSAAQEWWSTDAVDSAYSMQYLAEYRGMVKLLVHNHIPFDVVVNPTAADLASYQTVILPDLEATSDEEATLLKEYTSDGGHLIATGPNPGGWDAYGSARSQYALYDVFGIDKSSTLPTSKVQTYGAGEARFFSGLLGKKYFTNAADAATAASSLLTAIHATSTPWLTTNAAKKVHVELVQTDDNLMLHYVNFIGVTGTFSVIPTTVSTTLKIPAGKEAVAVKLTSPDNATSALSPLTYTESGQDVTFSVPIAEYAMVVVSLRDSGPVANTPPVAVDDTYATTNDSQLVVGAPGVLLNDSDANGDPLTVASFNQPTVGGAVAVNANGAFTYTPTSGFGGTVTFDYTLSDYNGGTDSGTVTITVSEPTANAAPVAGDDSYVATRDNVLTIPAPGVLTNDRDPDGDALSASLRTPPANGTASVAANGGFAYTPALGFSGADSFEYTVGDGKGGSGAGTVNITVSGAAITPQTVFPTAVGLTTGTLDFGTLASFRASDGNTYDVKSAFVSAENGGVTDWSASTFVSGSASGVTRIRMTYSGQYSKASVNQQVYLFNFATNAWVLVDSRLVGNQTDVTVTIAPANPQDYLSPTGEMRARVKGYRAGAQSTTAWKFFCWANLLKWDVE